MIISFGPIKCGPIWYIKCGPSWCTAFLSHVHSAWVTAHPPPHLSHVPLLLLSSVELSPTPDDFQASSPLSFSPSSSSLSLFCLETAYSFVSYSSSSAYSFIISLSFSHSFPLHRLITVSSQPVLPIIYAFSI